MLPAEAAGVETPALVASPVHTPALTAALTCTTQQLRARCEKRRSGLAASPESNSLGYHHWLSSAKDTQSCRPGPRHGLQKKEMLQLQQFGGDDNVCTRLFWLPTCGKQPPNREGWLCGARQSKCLLRLPSCMHLDAHLVVACRNLDARLPAQPAIRSAPTCHGSCWRWRGLPFRTIFDASKG